MSFRYASSRRAPLRGRAQRRPTAPRPARHAAFAPHGRGRQGGRSGWPASAPPRSATMRWPSATGVPLGWLPQPSPGAELRAGDPQRGEGLVLLDYGLIARWLQPWQGRPASTTERNVTSGIVEPVPHDVAIVRGRGRPTGVRRRTRAVPATRPRARCRGDYGLPGGTAVRRVSGGSRALELDPRREAVLGKAGVRLLGGRPPGGERHQPRQPDLCVPADQVDPGLARLAHLLV